jgi:hypothetical protein
MKILRSPKYAKARKQKALQTPPIRIKKNVGLPKLGSRAVYEQYVQFVHENPGVSNRDFAKHMNKRCRNSWRTLMRWAAKYKEQEAVQDNRRNLSNEEEEAILAFLETMDGYNVGLTVADLSAVMHEIYDDLPLGFNAFQFFEGLQARHPGRVSDFDSEPRCCRGTDL